MENKDIKKCSKCGSDDPKRRVVYKSKHGENLCMICYKFESIPKHPTPPRGTVKYDEFGKFICHICGGAFDSAGQHISQKHGMSPREYKEKFGLNKKQSLSSLSYLKHIQERVQNNPNQNKNLQRFKGHRKGRDGANKKSDQYKLSFTLKFHESCYIGIEQEDGIVDYVYCYVDGMPQNAGKILLNNYTNRMILETLISKGDFPRLSEDIHEVKPYFPDQEKKSTTVERFLYDTDELENNYRYLFKADDEWVLKEKQSVFNLNYVVTELIE